jgi:hypothetical protein
MESPESQAPKPPPPEKKKKKNAPIEKLANNINGQKK